jgi:phospholipid/cholesterol/gamma-HCH transport system substrate-binding protein
MRRVLAIAAVVAVVVAVVVLVARGGDDDAYRVRAIFMNASFLVKDVDVKVAGVKVGKVESLDVTDDNRAAVVLRIDDQGFQDFRKDAECSIRPQSLIGDKFVECTLTQDRPAGQQPPGPATVIQEGDGKGQHLVPIEHTSKPIDPDLVVDVWKLPIRQRLSIILNELGTGLAGQGDALRQAIRNADPTLKELDKVVQILAGQNRVLADLARDSDRVLAPLARQRRSVADFITNGQKAAEATAERRAALEETIRLLPPFLRQLRPTMDRLGGLADEMTPVLTDVGSVAPDVNRFVTRLEPFSRASLPAFRSLGAAADVGRPVLNRSEPFFKTLRDFTLTGQLVGLDLRKLAVSLRDTGGIERLMDFFFYLSGSTNGYDQFGHYFRIGLRTLNACLAYQTEPVATCNANFFGARPEDAVKEAEKAKQEGQSGGNTEAAARAAGAGGARAQAQDAAAKEAPAPAASSGSAGASGSTGAAQGGTGTGSSQVTSTDTALLDYLMGG